jgi:hypothetical protein
MTRWRIVRRRIVRRRIVRNNEAIDPERSLQLFRSFMSVVGMPSSYVDRLWNLLHSRPEHEGVTFGTNTDDEHIADWIDDNPSHTRTWTLSKLPS